MAPIRNWERKAFAATVALAVTTAYALHTHAPFSEYGNVVLWILGLYIGVQAGQQVGFAKFGLLGGTSPTPAKPVAKPSVKTPAAPLEHD